ncbi:MAG: hypothetical protein HGA37_06355 [Lentimicrobium sp.]|nr:hypothetical protein [Lentimicrobium sp.]
MQNIITEADLRTAIVLLESKQAEEGRLMKAQFLIAVESIKPINLIKSTLMEAAESRDLQDNLINSSVGLSAGYISKVLFQGATGGPIKKVLGTAIMFGIKNLIARNPETVKSLGKVFFNLIKKAVSKKEEKDQPNEPLETYTN